jgi:hypothetical protein
MHFSRYGNHVKKQATILVACFALGLRYVISIVPYWLRFLRRTNCPSYDRIPPADRGFVLPVHVLQFSAS